MTCEPSYYVTGYVVECSGGGGSSDGGGGGSNNPGSGTGGNTSFPSPIEQGCKSLAPASVGGKNINLQPLIPTTPDDPCLVKPIDCAGVSGGSAYLATCGCIGGTTGVPTCPPDINNNVKDPCLKKMVDAAINKDVIFNIKESMNSIFNQNTDFNIDFMDASPQTFSAPTIDGATGISNVHITPIKNPDGTILRNAVDFMRLEITLNTNLSSASKEYITATIMHEAIHAYLDYSRTIVNQHLDMARNYINSMTTQLKAIYPNLSEPDARALAWGGVTQEAGTLYTNLSQVEKDNISITNKAYKNGTNGTPCK